LDESVPIQVAGALVGHTVATVSSLGWTGMANGDLLTAAEAANYEDLVVADKNLHYQQNLTGRRIGIVELWTNHRPTLERYFAQIADAVNTVTAGAYVVVSSP
jgi:hypothetical protein